MGCQKILFVSLMMWGVCWGAAIGQPPPPRVSPWGTPDVWQGDRFVGFVPQHVKAHSRSPVPGEGSHQTLAQDSRRRTDANTVALASLEECMDGEVLVASESGDFVVDAPMCSPCDGFTPFPQVWVRGEYLVWWTKGMNTPPLVTTSPNGTPQAAAGVLGQPGTSILFGESGLNGDARSGGRITLGMWLDSSQTQGLDITYLGLEDETQAFVASDDGFSILARPFFNVQTGLQDARLIDFPNLVEGTVAVHTSTEFQAVEVMFRRVVSRSHCSDLSYILGYRYAKLEDQLRVSESTLSLSGPTNGTTFALFDHFATKNSFHGGELGLKYNWQRNSGWSLDLVAKVALGSTRSQALVLGQTTTAPLVGAAIVTQAGLLAQSTNIGVYESDDFSTLSEFGVTLRKDLNCHFTATFGYDFFYWSDVLRASEQIDPDINPSQIPPGLLVGAARPRFPFSKSDFWAQGLHFGIEYWY